MIYPPNAAKLNAVWNYVEPSQRFKQVAQRAATADVAVGWRPPVGCSGACNYTFTYNAPALMCEDLTADDIWDGHSEIAEGKIPRATLLYWNSMSGSGVFNATSNMGFNLTNWRYSTWAEFLTYNLTVSLMPHFDGTSPPSAYPIGSACTFYDATYLASTTFVNNTQATSTAVLSYNSPLSSGNCTTEFVCTFSEAQYDPQRASLPSYAVHAISSRAMVEAFLNVIEGNLTYSPHTGQMESAGDTTAAYWTPLFSLNQTSILWTFDLTAPSSNLSQGLTQLFANVTLGFISISSDISMADSSSSDSESSLLTTASMRVNMTIQRTWSQYAYTPVRLVTIYGLAVFLVGIGAVYGFWCRQMNGGLEKAQFSDILATTVDAGLNAEILTRKDVRLQCGTIVDHDDIGEDSEIVDRRPMNRRRVFRTVNY
jgi:hypothetical protein